MMDADKREREGERMNDKWGEKMNEPTVLSVNQQK
jgi:hypothetical protein